MVSQLDILLLIDSCIIWFWLLYIVFENSIHFFSELILVKKNMYGAKSRPLRFFIVLLHTPRPANSFASIAAHKTDRRRNRGGFLSCCYIPGSHSFIKDWIAFIPDCFRTPNACGKRSELTKHGIIIKEVKYHYLTWTFSMLSISYQR